LYSELSKKMRVSIGEHGDVNPRKTKIVSEIGVQIFLYGHSGY
jgi:hypothetical protein